MESTNTDINEQKQIDSPETEVKWDYTTREQTLFTGALVVGLNLLIIILFALDRTVPAIHNYIIGKH